MLTADILIQNAHVLTMDDDSPSAESVAIVGNRIVAVGTNEALRGWSGPATRRVDARGGTLLPGFIESHIHLFAGAYGRKLLQLTNVCGFDAMQTAVRAFADAKPDEGLLIAKGAEYGILGQDERITRHHLDRMINDRPLIIYAFDHHTAWANTIALEKAGILNGRSLGPGNEIVMGDDGLATGELRENLAIGPVMALRTSGGREMLGLDGLEPDPAPTPNQRQEDIETLKDGLRYCAECGITAIHNMDGNRYQLELLAEIEAQGELVCRVEVPYHLTNSKPLSALEQASALTREFNTEKLKSGRVKIFADGVLESGTALLLDDYVDQPGNRGEPLFSAEAFAQAAIEIDRRGLQISVHAVGDAAVKLVLDGYEAAQRQNGKRDSRHRIEHLEVIDPADIPRFADMGVIASMQPPHAPTGPDVPLELGAVVIGPARWPHTFAWQSVVSAGAPFAFSSDWPVSPLDPILGIHQAMTRQPFAPDLPDQRLSLTQTLEAYTSRGAFAGFQEHSTGRIKTDMLADLVLLSANIDAAAPNRIDQLKPVLTLCDGQVTFAAD